MWTDPVVIPVEDENDFYPPWLCWSNPDLRRSIFTDSELLATCLPHSEMGSQIAYAVFPRGTMDLYYEHTHRQYQRLPDPTVLLGPEDDWLIDESLRVLPRPDFL